MAATKPPKIEKFVDACLCEGVLKVDRDKGLIEGVKVAGLESLNGRTYAAGALNRAINLYEGAKVNVNHPRGAATEARDYRDRIGVVRGVHFRDGKGLFGTLHFNPKHVLAEQLAWDAENSPANVGFSHNVDGRGVRKGGKLIVEEITKVRSVDLVADPATTVSLYEHADAEHDTTLAAVVEGQQGDASPLLPLLENFVASQPAMGALPMAPPDPNAMGAVPGANPALREALKQLLNALADDATIDDAALADELKKLVAAVVTKQAAESGDDPFAKGDGEPSMADDKPKPVKEQIEEAVAAATKPLTEQLAALGKDRDARAVLEAKGARVTGQLVEELSACADKSAMETLVAGWTPAKLGQPKPRVGSFTEAVVDKFPDTHEGFVRAVKHR